MLLAASDRVTKPLRDIAGGSRAATEALRGTRERLRELDRQQEQLNSFATLRAGMRSSATAMRAAEQRAAALGREIEQTAKPTRAIKREFAEATRAAEQLATSHRHDVQQLRELRGALQAAGANTRDLAGYERNLASRYADTNRELAEQEHRLERVANREQRMGAARDRFSRTMGTASNVAGAGMGMLATAGAMALPIVAGIKGAQEYESAMTDIGQKANLTRAATARMGVDLLRAARAANQLPEAMQGGVDTLSGFGLDPRQATAMMQPIGRAATAYKAEISDLAAASFAAHDNLKVALDDTGRMIDAMAAAGKAGAFEVKDMAQYFPSLSAAYQGLGQTGVAAGSDLAAALQITRKGAGDSASAATNLGNILQKITSPATVRAFGKMGVDLPKALKRMYAEGKTPIEAISELTNKTLKGDLSRLGYLFEDAQVQQGLRPLIQNMEEYRRIRSEAMSASGTTDTDFAERLRDSEEQTKQLTVNAQTLGIQLGTVLLPNVNDLLGKAAAMASRLGDWSQRHPALTKAIVLATVAITALMGAAALLTLAYAAMMGPMALFGALSTATGIAMAPLIGIVLGVVAAVALLAYGAYQVYNNWGAISGFFGGIWERIRSTFTSNWAFIRNLLLGALVIFMPPVAALMLVAKAVYGNWDRIRAGFMAGVAFLAAIVGPMVQPLYNALNLVGGLVGRFSQMGLHLIQGLGRGILSGVGWVLKLITNVATTIGGAFAKAMGIHSPSRVFMAYGGHLMAGLHNGIDNDADAPVGRMTRLSRDLTRALAVTAATPALAVAGGAPGPGSPPAAPRAAAPAPLAVTININGANRDPQEIATAVEQALARFDAARRADSYSAFADDADWNV
ncbi:phage tail tape measure protein [Sphingomonas desiccabilis]|uniref:Phage tail tape measure protein n=2 Tax=Sphingomonas desiccabilis TaxID=429134 RepID=A0A4Q2J1J5_9SPHN|nr:phage tail tape measure protein [Sphingomonas desiccabilis]